MSEHDAYRSYILDDFVGLRNNADPTRLPPTSQAVASNIVFDSLGNFFKRAGREVYLANVVDMFTTQDRRSFYVVKDTGEVTLNETSIGTIVPDIYQWCEFGEYVYLLSRTHAYVIKQRTITDWRRSISPANFFVTTLTGNLLKGTYKVVFLAEDVDVVIDVRLIPVDIGQGIFIQNNSQTPVRVLISKLEYTVFTDFGILSSSLSIVQDNDFLVRSTRVLLHTSESVLTDAVSLCWYASSIWLAFNVGDQGVIVPSRPTRYYEFEYDSEFIQVFPKSIQCLAADSDSLYVATNSAIYSYSAVSGIRQLFPFGVPRAANPQCLFSYTFDKRIMLQTVRGPVVLPNTVLPQGFFSSEFDGEIYASVIDEVGGSQRNICVGNFEGKQLNRLR